MSNYSSAKRLQNDIAAREENSDRRIPSDMYYIVIVEIHDSKNLDDALAITAKKLLKTKKDHQALVAYIYRNELYLLFSSVEGREHYLKGSHQSICSEYASFVSIEFGCKTNVRIVEIESRTGILVYFQTKIFDNAKKSVLTASKNTITKKEISQFTLGELISALQQRAKVSWDSLVSGERFGTFYKYVVQDKKEKYILLTELINIQDTDKYISYFFE